MSWQEAFESFVVTNGLMGATFAACGALIAWHRPRHPVGWLFLANSIGHTGTALAVSLSVLVADGDTSSQAARLLATAAAYLWPWSVGLFLPIALLLFPDGTPVTPRWRWAVAAVVVTAPLFVVQNAALPEPIADGLPIGYGVLEAYGEWQALWVVSELRTLLALALGFAALAVRYRRADEQGRRQLLWLVLAVLVVVVIVIPWAFLPGTPIGVLMAIPLIPVAVTVAIVRHQLLDIRLVLSRTVSWVLLSVLALGAYAVLVGVLADLAVTTSRRSTIGAVATALLLAPVLPRLQGSVERLMYGDRREPSRVVSRLGMELSTRGGDLAEIATGLKESLRLPFVLIRGENGVIASAGEPSGATYVVPLTLAGEAAGSIEVGLRTGERVLSPVDRDALHLVASTVAVAVRSALLTGEIQASRERIVLAREEERRRLRRDLHDGLGPSLTGIALAADAAANLLGAERSEVAELVGSVRRDARTTLKDVRRVVEGLRPPALDEHGLVGAIQLHCSSIEWQADGRRLSVDVDASQELAHLPAGVEVAAYRITLEAITNAVRHADARLVCVTIACTDVLTVEIVDDGQATGSWTPGTGIQSMTERAEELGGRVELGSTRDGGAVRVTLPVGANR